MDTERETELEDTRPFAVLELNSRQIYWTNGQTVYNPNIFWPTTVEVDTPIGNISRGKSTVVFKNLDLRQIIGLEEWNKHEVFALSLVNFSSIPFSGGSATNTTHAVFGMGTTIQRRVLAVQLAGLNWVNSSFSLLLGDNNSMAFLTTLANRQDNNNLAIWTNPDQGIIGNSVQYQDTDNITLYFQKTRPVIDLTVFFSPESANLKSITTTNGIISTNISHLVWDFIMRFTIQGIR